MKTLNEIEFFSINQYDAFLSLANKIIANYNSLGGNLPKWDNKVKLQTPLQYLISKVQVIVFDRGDPLSVKPFLQRVSTGKIRGLGKPEGDAFARLEDTFLGLGHFRNGKAYTLNEMELKALRMYLAGNTIDSAITSFKYKGLEISATLVNSGVKFTHQDSDKTFHNQFKVTITNVETSKNTKFDFYGSHNDYTKGVKELKDIELLEAFECFISDAISAEEDFKNWCDNFGYDSDSRKAHKIYKECVKSLEKAQKIISGDMYEFYNELQETVNG